MKKSLFLSLSVLAFSSSVFAMSQAPHDQQIKENMPTTMLSVSAEGEACDPSKAPVSLKEFSDKLRAKYPNTNFTKIEKSEISGLFEVIMGRNVAYADATGRYFVFGHLFDMETRQDLTQIRLDDANKVEWSSIPFEASFSVKKGDGSRHVAVFSDPDCPYCRKLETELEQVTNVTIHYFPMPLAMHPQAKPKVDAAWCSKDKASSWYKIMKGEKIADASKGCEAPTNTVNFFASKVGISGTPALIRMDGKIMPGFAPAAKLNQWLDEAKK